MRHTRRLAWVRGCVVLGMLAWALPGLAAGVPDFCFLHISDIHVEPAPLGSPPPSPDARSARQIAWVCEQVKQPQKLEPFNLVTTPPAFVINTGDFTEFGVIGNTWTNVEQLFKPLAVPMYFIPGNHDNVWNSMLQIMWKQYGGDNYSFDKFGCHFVGIDTATPQEPLPSFDERVLTWLAADLKKVGPTTPVFLFFHHVLKTTEFAAPYDQLRFLETIRGYNVVALLMGHGHSATYQQWNDLDCVEGGSTFGENAGYSILSVQNGILRVVYRHQNPEKPMKTLLVKPIAPRRMPSFELVSPATSGDKVTGEVAVQVRPRVAAPRKMTANIDADDAHTVELSRNGVAFRGSVSTEGLIPGAHFLEISGTFDAAVVAPQAAAGGQARLVAGTPAARRHAHGAATSKPAEDETGYRVDRAEWFVYSPSGGPSESRLMLPAGCKAAPVLAGGDVLVATTSGEIRRVSYDSGAAKDRLVAGVGAVVLCAPAIADGVLYVGASDTAVHALSVDGKPLWKRVLGACAYGTPALDKDNLYVCDLEGTVHALDRKTGAVKWSKHHASMGIEQSPLLHAGVLYFGAWDGFVYAVNAADGSLKWKKPAPSGFAEEKKFHNRYYSAADCSPIIVGDRLFVSDRAYIMGSYSLAGEYLGQIATDVAAVGLASDGKSFYVRGMDTLARYDAEGKPMWSQKLTLGRFPAPPVEAGGKVYVCSNRGLLTVADAATGQVAWQYQVTPQLFVMGPVAADAGGNAYVAGMDGSVTRVHR